MALNVQFVKSNNALINEGMVTARLVNQQTLDYDAFCDYMAQGSTVTAADVSAVMKQLEKNLPTILSLNAKVVVSPDGLAFRPTVKGSMTQSQLKNKLIAKRDAYLAAGDTKSAAEINIDREIEAGDLTTGDITACIVIDLPKRWDSRFQQTVTFKRVNRVVSVAVDENGNAGGNENENSGTGSGNTNTGSGTQTPSGSGDDDDFTPPAIGD